MATAVLNVKIDEALKERLRHYAEVNNENLSVTTEKLLLLAFEAVEEAGVSEEDVDNQHTEEESVTPFTPKEIKALRKLLKKRKCNTPCSQNLNTKRPEICCVQATSNMYVLAGM